MPLGRVMARAPNHLGDGVMALPAMHALAEAATSLVIQAPGWGAALYRGVRAEVRPRGPVTDQEIEVAVLFPPSFRVAWDARRVPRRVGVAADGRWWLLTDIVGRRRHRIDTYAAIVEAVGARVEGPPRYALRPDDPVVDLPEGHIGLNPVSPSGETVQWGGYTELLEHLDRPVVFYGGPGEEEQVERLAAGRPTCVGLPFPGFASALQRCALFVSNDSGAAHFARACGVPTVVLFGSTVPERTGAHGSIPVQGPPLPCRPCYRKHCALPEPGVPCLEIPVRDVAARIVEALEAPCGG